MRHQHTTNSEARPERSIQTLARAYDAISRGEAPWVAVNEFFHEWDDYEREQRAALIADPLPPCVPSTAGLAPPAPGNGNSDLGELWRWAVFCVAAAEYLCARDSVPCPAWIRDPTYTLSEPWYGFGDPGATTPEMRVYLEQVTPEPLRRRNILGGARIFATKYDAAAGIAGNRGGMGQSAF